MAEKIVEQELFPPLKTKTKKNIISDSFLFRFFICTETGSILEHLSGFLMIVESIIEKNNLKKSEENNA